MAADHRAGDRPASVADALAAVEQTVQQLTPQADDSAGPMPAPAITRVTAKNGKFIETAVSALPSRYTPRVSKNSFRRPSLSVSRPKRSAPSTSPNR